MPFISPKGESQPATIYFGAEEPNSDGVDLGFSEPTAFPPDYDLDVPSYTGGGGGGNPFAPQCYVDGIPDDGCRRALSLVSLGFASVDPRRSDRWALGRLGFYPRYELVQGKDLKAGDPRLQPDTGTVPGEEAIVIHSGSEHNHWEFRGYETIGGGASAITSFSIAPAERTKYGRVTSISRNIDAGTCRTRTTDGVLVSLEEKGIVKDVTQATIEYSPVITAPELTSQQPKLGLYGNDVRGHIIGRALGGFPTPENLFSQNGIVNNGDYKSWEYKIRKVLTDHQDWTAHVTVVLTYPVSSCQTPNDKSIYYRPSGVVYTAVFKKGSVFEAIYQQPFPNPP